ncbi:hypothetical protein KIN20_019516 [Parelaphostrongylus tenuis]|uniref:Uncharacterized protein n=1 Tax=Parelaphostrongylus tenuis TaxID=148309 RepID=A0AAD5QQ85_PARTN|nr:hypothetical protein KIN20_019516 [Parelaphostrongylus tenuis]
MREKLWDISIVDGNDRIKMPLPHCVVFGDTVTALCLKEMPNMCQISTNMNIGGIEAKYLSISGSLTV